MAALFNPIYRRGEPIKWGILSYTVVMFSLVTVETTMRLRGQSIAYIDNRESPSILGVPFKYQGPRSDTHALRVILYIIYSLNNWLADGLLVSSLFGAAFAYTGV